MTSIKRRALVLTDEAARHPFLRSLPAHVRASAVGEPASPRSLRNWSVEGRDWRDFFLTYCAAFVAVTAFIS